jgi:AmiR/NasT family two-component response regulator
MSALNTLRSVPRTALAVFRLDSARDFACDVLRAAGVLNVEPVADVCACDHQVDIIVTDWPEDTSLDAHIDAIRSNCVRRDTPIMLLTTRESRADVDAARSAGVDAVVVSPVSPAMLKHRLSRLMIQAPTLAVA